MKPLLANKSMAKFPSIDDSKLILNVFRELPVVGQEYYFEDDMQLHGTTFTEVKFFYYGGIFADWPLGQFFHIDQNKYNTIFYGEMKKLLITFKDDDGNVLLDDQPCASFTANYGSISNVKFNRYRRRFLLKNVALKASFVRWIELPITPLPFVAPFQLKYR